MRIKLRICILIDRRSTIERKITVTSSSDSLRPTDSSVVPRFAGIATFAPLPRLDQVEHAPGTGTPEAGGLTSRELLSIIRSLSTANVVGADVVEVSPAYDHAQLTAIAASHVAYELISSMAPRCD